MPAHLTWKPAHLEVGLLNSSRGVSSHLETCSTFTFQLGLPAENCRHPRGNGVLRGLFFFEVRGEVAGTFDLEAGTSVGWPAQFFKRRVFSLGSILDFHIPTWSSSSKLPAPLGEWGSKEGEGNMPFLALQKSCRHI